MGGTSAQVAIGGGAYLGIVAVILAGTRSTRFPLLVDTLCILVEELRVQRIMSSVARAMRVKTARALARGGAAYLLALSTSLMGLITLALVLVLTGREKSPEASHGRPHHHHQEQTTVVVPPDEGEAEQASTKASPSEVAWPSSAAVMWQAVPAWRMVTRLVSGQ